ncbi:MBL fold metallo-hydrolase [Pedobacter sp. BS3]|uniref:MBL fold metallo-hydrolase n=1 Tax=Pedobacter sp. BS3 TaxID=2567937 RepID=UPI00165998AD|nr:MBL fold metallo-hydrolase [Pedobacter sp. BS3]
MIKIKKIILPLLFLGCSGAIKAQFLSPDASFATGTGFNGTVWELSKQSDGKIIASGEFTSYNGTTVNKLTRLADNGSLDAIFNTNLGTGFNNTVYTHLLQSDGKIVVAGDFTAFNGNTRNRIVRLNANGTIDNTFSIGTGLDAEVLKVALQSDGKILAAGSFTTANGVSSSGIVRLNTNGSRDNTFSVGSGFNVNDGGIGNRPVRDIALQSDGKIIVAGEFTSYNGTSVNRLVRLNTDGSIDNTFTSKIKFDDVVYGVKVQPDGKILAVGAFSTCNSEHASYKIARINTDGTLDVDFNTNIGTGFYARIGAGTGTGFFKDEENPRTIVLQADGKILIGGDFVYLDGVNSRHFVRLNADGTLGTPNTNPSGFTLYQLKIQANTIGNSYIIKTSNGKLIVMDGGYEAEETYLRNFINSLGGKVEAWFLSHPHQDHAGAFNEILKNLQGIEIKNIYHSKPPASWVTSAFYQDLYNSIDNAAQNGVNVVNYTTIPNEVITIDQVNFRILSVANPELSTASTRINNSSMAIRVWDEQKSIVFLADLQLEGGNKLLNSPQRQYLDCDYLQMSHHGNDGVGKAFYRSVRFKACLWPTPGWLWDNQAGSAGFNTGGYDTLEQREIVDNELGIRRNYIGSKGLNIIK